MRLLFILSLLIQITSVYSQSTHATYPSGILRMENGVMMDAKQIVVKNQKVMFLDKRGAKIESPLSDVYYLKIPVGNNAERGALIGLAIGASTSALAALQVSADPSREFKDNAGVILLGITAGSAGLGALIGSGQPKYKTIYEPSEYFSGLRFGIQANGIGFAYVLR